MPPRTTKICSSFAASRAFRVRIIVAAVFGAGACPGWVLAQQAGGGAKPRRAESTAAVERAGSPRAILPAGQAARGGNAGAKGAAATSGRAGPSPNAAASTRARAPASGVRQTSAVVTADGGVVLAGHAVAAADCRQCGQRGCGKCRPAGGRLDLPCNGLCSQGSCPAGASGSIRLLRDPLAIVARAEREAGWPLRSRHDARRPSPFRSAEDGR